MLSSNLKVYRSSRLPSFTQGVSLMIFSMAYGALVTTSLLKSIIDGDLQMIRGLKLGLSVSNPIEIFYDDHFMGQKIGSGSISPYFFIISSSVKLSSYDTYSPFLRLTISFSRRLTWSCDAIVLFWSYLHFKAILLSSSSFSTCFSSIFSRICTSLCYERQSRRDSNFSCFFDCYQYFLLSSVYFSSEFMSSQESLDMSFSLSSRFCRLQASAQSKEFSSFFIILLQLGYHYRRDFQNRRLYQCQFLRIQMNNRARISLLIYNNQDTSQDGFSAKESRNIVWVYFWGFYNFHIFLVSFLLIINCLIILIIFFNIFFTISNIAIPISFFHQICLFSDKN